MVLPSCLVHVLLFDNTVQHSHNIPSERLKGSASQLRWSNLLQPQLDFLEPKNPRLGARMLEVARSCYTNASVQFCLSQDLTFLTFVRCRDAESSGSALPEFLEANAYDSVVAMLQSWLVGKPQDGAEILLGSFNIAS